MTHCPHCQKSLAQDIRSQRWGGFVPYIVTEKERQMVLLMAKEPWRSWTYAELGYTAREFNHRFRSCCAITDMGIVTKGNRRSRRATLTFTNKGREILWAFHVWESERAKEADRELGAASQRGTDGERRGVRQLHRNPGGLRKRLGIPAGARGGIGSEGQRALA